MTKFSQRFHTKSMPSAASPAAKTFCSSFTDAQSITSSARARGLDVEAERPCGL
jgi:hypothetical protein